MTSIATLSELKSHFDQSMSGPDLVLTPDNATVDRLVTFLSGLPVPRLTLPGADIQLTAVDLTISATTDERWPIGGTGDRGLHVTGVRLVFTQPAGLAVALHVTGGVAIDGAEVPVAGDLDDAGRISARLVPVPAPGPARPVSLATLADFVSDHTMAGYLPPAIPPFDTVPLSDLAVSFGYGAAAATELTSTSTLDGATWEPVAGLASLTGIGVTLTNEVRTLPGLVTETVGGDIHATVHLGQDFTVRLALRAGDWAVEVLPADGNVLPALADLASLAGDHTLGDQLQNGFRALGLSVLAIDGVRVAFDLPTRAVRQVMIAGHVTLDEIEFDIEVALPDLAVHGLLSPTTPIHLKALVSTYFPGGEHFPEIDITALDLAATPGSGSYTLEAAIAGDWTFDVGPVPVGFQEFMLEIQKDSDGMTGSVEGLFTLFDAGFDVVAEQPAAGGGWQFTGQSVPGSALTVAAIHAHIAEMFSVHTPLPAAIEGLSLEQLRIWFDTATGDFNFTCEARFPIDDQEVDITVTIRLDKTDAGYRKTFGGHLTIAGLVFDLGFEQDAASTVFVAVYSHTGAARRLLIRDLVAAVSTSVADLVPGDLEIDLHDVLIAVSKGTQAGFLLGLDLGAQFGLSQLPLVGQEFPPERKVGLDSLRLLVASRDFAVSEISPVNALLPAVVPPLPDVTKDARQGQPAPAPTTVALTQGVTVTARLLLGGDSTAQTLSLPAGGSATSPTALTTPSSASGPAATPAGNTRWFDVQRSFGPVYFDRVGFAYENKTVQFLLDAALSAAGLTLSLDGLTLGSAISHFDPTFDLRGIGLDYRNGPVEVGGALLRTTVTQGGVTYDEYDGAALIRTEQLSIAALGAYAYVNGAPSLFVYAVLDAALGGPPFLFVTGLAAGFGYNRAIVVPPVDKVADFPLVTAAMSPQPITGTASPGELLRSTVDKMRTVIPPTAGSIFLAVGIKFMSFRIVDSFVLVVASFGQRFELNVLGLSTVVAPAPQPGTSVTPLAEVQLAVKASFIPDEGFLGVSAQLTQASFLFSRDCHITGGFAFYTWFSGEHAGDFVLSVGGYHPNFRVPANYPVVPRLGFNWQVDPQLVVKGDAYYALTPLALMAGGHLEAVWQSGNLRASFLAGADFIVAWQPYHYDAHAYVDVNVSYTFEFFGTHHIDADLGADLHLWGPEFAGTAHISLSIISFDVTFGPQNQPGPKPIDWTAFRQSFLPSSGLCAVAVSSGLLRKSTDAPSDLGTIDPQRLALLVSTVIPSTVAHIRADLPLNHLYYTGTADKPVFVPFIATDAKAVPAQAPTASATSAGAVAVGPMGIKLPQHAGPHLRATLTITVTRGTEPMEHHFGFVPVLKPLPAGMWGELNDQLRPDPNDPALVRDALAGFEIRPASAPQTGTDPATVDGTVLLQYHLPTLPGGSYHIALTQTVTTDEPTVSTKIPAQAFSGGGDFAVAGARNALAPDEVYAMYPPPDALGDYADDLPHVILRHSTLPWQETADPNRDDLPWLALLLFDDTDRPTPQVVTVGELRQPTAGVVFPPGSLGANQPDSDQVTVIDIRYDHLRQLLPPQDAQRRDLALLSHVRQAPDGTERAVIISNRLPKAGAAHVAHLVSVRGRYRATGFDAGGAADDTPVRLISLTSWRFASTATAGDVVAILRRIADRGGALEKPDSDHGYLPIGYQTRTGDQLSARYRGPLVPAPAPESATLPVRSADDLMRSDDASFASAWQLGRLLALHAKPFAAALYRWKRARSQSRKSGSTQLPPVPALVTDWLNDMALVRGVPFNYLVPDEGMLPVESVRFFSVHSGWLACLLDGALSTGRVTPADLTLDQTLAADLRGSGALTPWASHVLGAGSITALSGSLIRSDLVAGWPDLHVTATVGGSGVDPLRTERMSPNTMLCLFPGEITAIAIALPTQVLHFNLGDTAAQWQQGQRVVDITALATTQIGGQRASQSASGQLAAKLLAPQPRVDIPRPLAP
jgi:hypothetical protein